MKRCLIAILVLLIAFQGCCFAAAEYDLPNMTTEELNTLKSKISEELITNHEPSSEQSSAVQNSIKAFVETFYGEGSVSWAWFDYTYSREWDFFTMKTHADIQKRDGGKAEYDVYGEVVLTNNIYETVFVQIGTEIIFDDRISYITDERVLTMLGLSSADTPATPSESETPTQTPSDENAEQTPDEPIIAQRGDKNDTVKQLQEMLLRLGYLNGSADGDFGAKTELAVTLFQTDNKMDETGKVTQSVYNAIEEAFKALPEPVEYPSYTARELYNLYDENEFNADAAVKGKIVQVTGKIIDFDTDLFGNPILYLSADGYGINRIGCNFSKKDTDILSSLKKNSEITVIGKCTGMSVFYVYLDDCTLAN